MSRDFMPGVPAAGHVTDRGFWHPGDGRRCLRCDPPVPKSITCPKCKRTSYHPRDIEEGYCGHCHDWTGERR